MSGKEHPANPAIRELQLRIANETNLLEKAKLSAELFKLKHPHLISTAEMSAKMKRAAEKTDGITIQGINND